MATLNLKHGCSFQVNPCISPGLCCDADQTTGLNYSNFNPEFLKGRNVLLDTPVTASSAFFLCNDGKCSECSQQILTMKEEMNFTYKGLLDEYKE